jgi:alpha-L-fucosidase
MKVNGNKKWWSESRFGMFIHWGIYSLVAKGEWVMYNQRIPVMEYEKLADQFNPVNFDADAWVKLAKDAGMQYIVITAKHHDGFSMFKTKVDRYNIVDSTPYGKDIMSDMAKACQKNGIRLCFYYSHVREWRHPHAQSLEMKTPDRYGNYGNFWDYPDENQKNLQIYLDEFDKPQLKELLTQYGPIGIIWFDTPSLIRPDQAQEIIDVVKSLQPDCLVNSRVGENVEVDYYSLGDDEVPEFNNGVDFETPMTICLAWGYNNMPNNRYRGLNELLHQFIDIVSLGGNYLLNVGPDPSGVIPPEAQERLRGIGAWMKVNNEAIQGTLGSPFPAKPTWGRITAKDDTLYLHLYQWNERISLTGIKSKVKAIHLLADPGKAVTWSQQPCGTPGYDRLTISLPGDAPDPNVSVVKVQFESPMQLETRIIEDDSGSIQLPVSLSTLHSSTDKPRASVNITGVVRRWLSTEDWFSWEFLCESPGEFNVLVTASSDFNGLWDHGHQIVVEFGDQRNIVEIVDTGVPTESFQKRTYQAGRIRIEKTGLYGITVRAKNLVNTNGQGFTMSMLKLEPLDL